MRHPMRWLLSLAMVMVMYGPVRALDVTLDSGSGS
jgi:hypothetical protein